MALDPNISLGVRPLQLADPLAQYGQMATIQNAQNQNALAQYQLGSAQRAEKTQNVLADAYSQSVDAATGKIDYNKLTGLVAAGGGGAQLPGIEKTRREAETAALTQQETAFKVQKQKNDFLAQAKRDTSNNPSDANLTAFREDLEANPLFSKIEKAQMAANVDRILAMPVDQRRSFMASQGATASDLKPSTQVVDQSGQRQVVQVPAFSGAPTVVGTFADVPLPPAVEAQRARIALAGRAPPQPRAEQPPVAVVDPVTGKPVYVSREQAISGKMSPASAQESLSPKEIQKREASYPQATAAVTGFETKSDRFIKDLIALRDHPGLGSITGIAAGRMPGITGEGRAAQALFDKAVAKGGFQALQDMRDASKTGGALGNVSNQEGKQLTASFAAINRTQDAPDVRAAIDQAIGDLQGAKVRTREAYDMTYGYKTGGAAAPATAMPPADRQALDWANSNAGDPRAAQIKQRLGQ
jgi:hypothetical protein